MGVYQFKSLCPTRTKGNSAKGASKGKVLNTNMEGDSLDDSSTVLRGANFSSISVLVSMGVWMESANSGVVGFIVGKFGVESAERCFSDGGASILWLGAVSLTGGVSGGVGGVTLFSRTFVTSGISTGGEIKLK